MIAPTSPAAAETFKPGPRPSASPSLMAPCPGPRTAPDPQFVILRLGETSDQSAAGGAGEMRHTSLFVILRPCAADGRSRRERAAKNRAAGVNFINFTRRAGEKASQRKRNAKSATGINFINFTERRHQKQHRAADPRMTRSHPRPEQETCV